MVGVEISNRPVRAVLFDRVHPHLKWIDRAVGAKRCTDVRTFKFSFKKLFWFLLAVLLICAAALTALYYMDRAKFKQIQSSFDDKLAKPLKRKLSKPDAPTEPQPTAPTEPEPVASIAPEPAAQ